VLDQLIKYDHEILEIGTGPYAILSLYLFKKGYYRIVATDINADYITSAMQTASFNDADLAIVKSNLFTNVRGKYDIIFFNAVYIPDNMGKNLGLYAIHTSKTHWCGGETGTETIENFLKNATHYLHPGGKILLGFNPHYVSIRTMHQLCKSCRYRVSREIKLSILPNIVFTLNGDNQ